jgi:hypothetical protein
MASLRRPISLEVRPRNPCTRRCANTSATKTSGPRSPVIAQPTSDFCIDASSIVRQAVKNAHDACLALTRSTLRKRARNVFNLVNFGLLANIVLGSLTGHGTAWGLSWMKRALPPFFRRLKPHLVFGVLDCSNYGNVVPGFAI